MLALEDYEQGELNRLPRGTPKVANKKAQRRPQHLYSQMTTSILGKRFASQNSRHPFLSNPKT